MDTAAERIRGVIRSKRAERAGGDDDSAESDRPRRGAHGHRPGHGHGEGHGPHRRPHRERDGDDDADTSETETDDSEAIQADEEKLPEFVTADFVTENRQEIELAKWRHLGEVNLSK